MNEHNDEQDLERARLVAQGLHQYINLAVAQIDAALREGGTQMDLVAQCLGKISSDLKQLEAQVAPACEPRAAELLGSIRDSVQTAVKASQFYDKLIQRLAHVRAGLALPADTVGRSAEVDWNTLAEQVRGCYSMAEERVLFDFTMRGLQADLMLKALQSLREAAKPGDLDLF